MEVGVPLATDLIGVSVAGFASGNVSIADGKIGLKDVDTKGLFGLVASVSGGFESAKAGSGVTAGFAGLDEDVYESAPDGVRAIYDALKNGDIDVSLVAKDGAACPNEREPVGCALAFGRKHSSHFLRARVFAEGLRKHAGKAEAMVSAIASTALAVGAVRDLASGGRSLSAATGRLCPQNKTPTPAK